MTTSTVIPIDKGLYWKVHCWSGVEKSICKFVFPKPNTCENYKTESIFVLREKLIKTLLENLSGEKICQEQIDNDFVSRINDIFLKMNHDIVCQLCSTKNTFDSIVEHNLPICTHCKALLMV